MNITEQLADALRRIHSLCGGDAWEYRQIALEALAAFEAAQQAGEQAPIEDDPAALHIAYEHGRAAERERQALPPLPEPDPLHYPHTPEKARFDALYLSLCERPITGREVARRCWKAAYARAAQAAQPLPPLIATLPDGRTATVELGPQPLPEVPNTFKLPGESDDAWVDRITGAQPLPVRDEREAGK